MQHSYSTIRAPVLARPQMVRIQQGFHGSQTILTFPPTLLLDKHTQGLVSQLAESPAHLHMYDEIVSDQEKQGFIEGVTDDLPSLPTSPSSKKGLHDNTNSDSL